MASLILRQRSQSIIPKPNQSLFTFSPLYPSSSSNNDGDSPPDLASYFCKIKNQQQRQQSSPNFNFTPRTSKAASFDEIRKNLSEFRRRGSDSPIPENARSIPNFGLNLNNKNVGNPNPSFSRGGFLSLDKIQESLAKMRENKGYNNMNEQLSLNNYKQSFRMKPPSGRVGNLNAETGTPSRVIGGSIGSLPRATFGDEIKEKESGERELTKFELFKHYTHAELEEKLKGLWPDPSKIKKKVMGGEDNEGWFSLSELQQRLGKLKEIEQKKSTETVEGLVVGELKMGLLNIELSNSKDKDRSKGLNFDLLTQESSMSPKKHLIEKYFHPDNMSSAEKFFFAEKSAR